MAGAAAARTAGATRTSWSGRPVALVFFALGGVYYVTVQHAPETLMLARPPVTIEQAAKSNLPLAMRSQTIYRLAQEEFIRRGNIVAFLIPVRRKSG